VDERSCPRRYAGVAVAVAVVAAVACACATVPTGGPIVSEKIAPAGGPQAGDYEQLIAPPPQSGWTPEQIVSGFLLAGADFTGDHKVAAQYLTPGARRSWHPGSKAIVFSSPPVAAPVSQRGNGATVQVSGQQVASIGSQGEGEYVATAHGGTHYPVTFTLHMVRGQWRIADPPDQLLLTSDDVARAYRSQDLYFFDPTMSALVPDPVFVPVQENPVPQSVQSLFRGATGWLSRATRTAFPPGTRLNSVDESGDVVRVDLGGAAAHTAQHQQELMSAQLAWTLREFPDAAQNLNLILEINGRPVTLPSIGSPEQPVSTSWQGYDPSGEGAGSSFPAFFVGDGNRVNILNSVGAGSQAAPVPGGAGTGQVPLHQIAVSPDPATSEIAGVSPGDDSVYTGKLSSSGSLAQQLSGKNFTNPSWDRDGNLWIAGSSGGKPGIWMLAGGVHPVQVRMPGGYGPVQALRVARDGARIALITGTGTGQQLLVGAIDRNGSQISIGTVVPIGTGLSQMAQMTDLAWSDADNLVVLAQPSGGQEQLFKVPVDGEPYQALGTAPAGTQSVAAAPGLPVLAGVPGSGSVQYSPDELSWRDLIRGQYPAYPG
jgi:Lipoprotein LpqB beta-propeller domain/Sporulation and spore germination